ncbi:cytochrome P450 6B6-like [Spodoptera frugiperda]|uniref:unspecific monooxygenase n=1 Tax=Spodoptera frugiperda TaxID=7108 RepID=A0A9R0CVG0_SPOFR|nr:cytochrome P450 6B6-like [Spodoptera frugiperda]
MFATIILAVAIVVLILTYLRGRYNENYWRKRGTVFYKRNKTFGPLLEFMTGERPLFQVFNELYWRYENEPVVGMGSLDSPVLYVKDPTNIQFITQTNFQNFSHRGITVLEEDYLANNVLFLHGPKWKVIRQKLTPIFTTTKLKNMFYIIDKSAQDFVEHLKQHPEKLKGDTYEHLSHFCTAALAAAVFGISTKSTFDSPFREMARQALTPTLFSNIRFAINSVSDKLFAALRLKFFKDQEGFFIGAIKEVLKQRRTDSTVRHDFIDLCLDLQKNGPMVDNESGYSVEPTDEVMAAQAFFFFLAGIDPTTAGMFGPLYELGRHPEIQKRVQDEVDAIFEKYGGKLTYDAVLELKFTECVLNEGLRLHPPIGFNTRQCVEDSVLPVGNVPVEKGTKIFMPFYELHHDPKYFPEPDRFDPDRFTRGEVSDMTYMPFGIGKRLCIGARYARMQILTAFAHILRNYTLVTHIKKGGMQYRKEQFQVRLDNCDIELVPRQQ